MGCNSTKQSTQYGEFKEEEPDKIIACRDEEVENIESVIVPPRKDDLTITIEKTDVSEKVGVHTKWSSPKSVVLSVTQIYEDGAAHKYNASASLENQLRTGDYIWDVNGISGDADKMLEEFRKATTLSITLQRGGGNTVDVAKPEIPPVQPKPPSEEKTPLLGGIPEDVEPMVNSDEANPKAEKPAASVDDTIVPTKATLESEVADDATKPDKKDAEEVADDATKPDIKKPEKSEEVPAEPSVEVTFDPSMLGSDMGTTAEVIPHADEVGPSAADQRSVCCSSAPLACN